EADDGGRDGESGREDEGPEPMALYAAGEGDRQQRQHAGRQRRERAGGEAEEAGAHAAAPARLERARKERADLAGIGAERRAAAVAPRPRVTWTRGSGRGRSAPNAYATWHLLRGPSVPCPHDRARGPPPAAPRPRGRGRSRRAAARALGPGAASGSHALAARQPLHERAVARDRAGPRAAQPGARRRHVG